MNHFCYDSFDRVRTSTRLKLLHCRTNGGNVFLQLRNAIISCTHAPLLHAASFTCSFFPTHLKIFNVKQTILNNRNDCQRSFKGINNIVQSRLKILTILFNMILLLFTVVVKCNQSRQSSVRVRTFFCKKKKRDQGIKGGESSIERKRKKERERERVRIRGVRKKKEVRERQEEEGRAKERQNVHFFFQKRRRVSNNTFQQHKHKKEVTKKNKNKENHNAPRP